MLRSDRRIVLKGPWPCCYAKAGGGVCHASAAQFFRTAPTQCLNVGWSALCSRQPCSSGLRPFTTTVTTQSSGSEDGCSTIACLAASIELAASTVKSTWPAPTGIRTRHWRLGTTTA